MAWHAAQIMNTWLTEPITGATLLGTAPEPIAFLDPDELKAHLSAKAAEAEERLRERERAEVERLLRGGGA